MAPATTPAPRMATACRRLIAASATDAPQCGVVQAPVGGDRIPTRRRARAGQVAELTPGLLDDDLRRRQVPQRRDGIDGDLQCALGQQHVGPEVAEAARAPARLNELDQPFAPPARGPVLKAAEGQLRVA